MYSGKQMVVNKMSKKLEKVLTEIGVQPNDIPDILACFTPEMLGFIEKLEEGEIREMIEALVQIYIITSFYKKGALRLDWNEKIVDILSQLELTYIDRVYLKEEGAVDVIDVSDVGSDIATKIIESKIRSPALDKILHTSHPFVFWLCNQIAISKLPFALEGDLLKHPHARDIDKYLLSPFPTYLIARSKRIADLFKEFVTVLRAWGFVAIGTRYNSQRIEGELDIVFPSETALILKEIFDRLDKNLVKEIDAFGTKVERNYKAWKFLLTYDASSYNGIGDYRDVENEIISYLHTFGNSVVLSDNVTPKGRIGKEKPFVVRNIDVYKKRLKEIEEELIEEVDAWIEDISERITQAKSEEPLSLPTETRKAVVTDKLQQSTVPEEKGELEIWLGYDKNEYDKNGNKIKINWNPYSTLNPHILIVGKSGSGKTQTVKAIVMELNKLKVPSIIFDFHNEYENMGDNVLNLRKGDVAINPLEIPPTSEPTDVKYMVSGILRNIYGLGGQQEANLRRAIANSYRDAGIDEKNKGTWNKQPPNFSDVKKHLEKMREENPDIQALLNWLEPIFDLGLFSKPTSISFENVATKTTVVELKELPNDKIKTAAVDFLLRKLWNYIYSLPESKTLRMYVVIDEGHRLAYKESPLSQLLMEGRKYGVGCILSSQRPYHFTEDILANLGAFLTLQVDLKKDAKEISNQINVNKDEIKKLKRFEGYLKLSHMDDSKFLKVVPYYERVGKKSSE